MNWVKKQRNTSDGLMEWPTRREVPERHSSFIEVKAGMDEKLPLVLIIMVVVLAVVVVVVVVGQFTRRDRKFLFCDCRNQITK